MFNANSRFTFSFFVSRGEGREGEPPALSNGELSGEPARQAMRVVGKMVDGSHGMLVEHAGVVVVVVVLAFWGFDWG